MKIKVYDVEFEVEYDMDYQGRIENMAVFAGEDSQELSDLLDAGVLKKIEEKVLAEHPQGPEDDPSEER
jgi:hypothetical protein